MSEHPFGLLGEIAKGKRGVSYKPEDIIQGTEQKHYRLLTAGNIQDGITTTDSYTRVPNKCVSQEQLISPDDILVCMSNGSKRLVGKSSRLRSIDSREYCVGAFCSTFTPTGSADPEFVFQVFQSEIFRKQVSDALEGSAINNLKNSTIENFQVPLPPLPEQKKVAEILSGIDKAISIKRQARNDLTATREAICSELIQNGDWSQEEIGDLASHMTNGFVGTATPHYRERGVRYLTSKNIRRDRIDPKRMIYISEEFHMANRKSSLMVGDVLMVQSGHIGTTAVVTNDYKDCNCHALILMRFNQERLDPEYASLYFNSATGKTRLSDIFVGSTVKHVNTGDLRKFKIPVPPLGVQRNIAKRISAIDLLLGKRELQIEKLVILKQAISSDLLSGRKRVSV